MRAAVSNNKPFKKRRPIQITCLIISLSLILLCQPIFRGFTWVYTKVQLSQALRHGAYATPEEAMIAEIEASYVGVENIEILSSSTNSFDGSNPHIWYVGVEVTVDPEKNKFLHGRSTFQGGSYVLHTKEGWVHVPEGAFPEFVGYGMVQFGLVP